MTGWKRWFYYNMGWEYDPTETTEKIKRNRHEVLVQIRSYGSNIKDIALREEGEIPKKIKATRCPTPTINVGVLDINNDFLDGTDFSKSRLSETLSLTPTECDAPKTIQEYTALFEGFDVPKKKKRRKRNPHKINF